jgi:ABC-type Fe3+/spermidine/putrescine transport system ATPase subunit
VTILSLQGLSKTYENGKRAVLGLDLDIEAGEIVSLLGPSGCGKTTTLRCVAGLEEPDGGTITLDGVPVFGPGVWLPPERRGMSMVFQQYALWPHMSVFDNVAFGPQARRLNKADTAAKVETALRRVGLWEERDRRISQLSGGQQQRTALARAVAVESKIILFDEPLSNLDARLRESMRLELLELQRDIGFTALYVTHDQDEAFSLSSRIVVMNGGAVEQVGTPWEIWRNPASPFVADFIGSANRLSGKLARDDAGLYFQSDLGPSVRVADGAGGRPGERATAFVRIGSLRATATRPSGDNVWRAPVGIQTFHGDHTLVIVGFGSGTLRCRRDNAIPTDAPSVYIQVDPADVLCFPEGEQ